jgi:hypothetical protein
VHLARLSITLGAPTILFLSSFISPLLPDHSIAQGVFVLGALIVAAACLLVGAGSLGASAAMLVGAAAGWLCLLSGLYGNYLSYLIGWHGLNVKNFGSDDNPGQRYVLISLYAGTVPALIVGALAGGVGSWWQHRRSRRGTA